MVTAAVAGMFGAGALLIQTGNRKHDARDGHELWVKYLTFAALVWGMILVSRHHALLCVAVLIFALLSLGELLKVGSYAGCAWVLAAAVMAMCQRNFLALFLIVAACDAFAQLGGRILGGPKLCPSLSPGKTVAGMFCGIAAGVVMGLLLGIPPINAAVLALSGQAGDLAASKIKRSAGVKDFGRALPGHGGFMDRFDSLWGAAFPGGFLC